MNVERLAEGFWRWTALHPEWSADKGGPGGWEAEVASVYLEGDDAVVLIDPLVPTAGDDRDAFWRALDRDLERLADRPLAILVSCPWHRRSAGEVAERYRSRPGTAVRAHDESAAFLAEIVPEPFRDADVLPGGILPYRIEGIEPAETAFWVPAHAALVFADAVIGAGSGSLRLCPPSWLAAGTEGRERHAAQVRPSVRRLCALPAERVLPSHGEPVLRGGAGALAEAVESPPWGE
jgi:glyoxylase-like metal-dependent hydrolase (beta-lactamase superfamily II)